MDVDPPPTSEVNISSERSFFNLCIHLLINNSFSLTVPFLAHLNTHD